MAATRIVRGSGRIPRIIAAHFLWNFPAFNRLAGLMGVIPGDRSDAIQVLEDGELLMVYPGGVREAAKGPNDRERLFWDGRTGFIKVALATGAPVVPAAVLGADDMFWRSDTRIDLVAKLTGDPDATVPLFMGLGLLPLPVNLKVRFGQPIPMAGGPERAEDDAYVQAQQDRVREAVESLLGTKLPADAWGDVDERPRE